MPFIQVVEVWRRGGDVLHYAGGLYGPHGQFAELSAQSVFRRGEGLPGSAWEAGRTRLWGTLGLGFMRAEAARAAGLAAGVAIPILHNGQCEAVITMLCGSPEQTGGCIELWTPNSARELVHSAGYYGGLSAFEELSKVMRFPDGVGLPGIAFAKGLPQAMTDLPRASAFSRAAAALDAGIDGGLAIPLFIGARVAEVLVFLSARATPLARAFEVWTYDDDEGALRLAQSHYAPELAAVEAASRHATYAEGEGVRGTVLATGLPLAFRGSVGPVARAPEDAGRGPALEGGVAIPMMANGTVRAVVVMLM